MQTVSENAEAGMGEDDRNKGAMFWENGMLHL